MIFIKTANGVLNAKYIVRAWLSREHDGYASMQFLHSDGVDETYTVRALCKIEELAKIGVSASDLASRPVQQQPD